MADDNDAATPEQPEGEPTPPENADSQGDRSDASGDPSQDPPQDPSGAADRASELAGEAAAQAEDGADMSDEEAAALASAMQAVGKATDDADRATGAGGAQDADQPGATPFESPELTDAPSGHPRQELDLLSDVHMDVRIELGRTRMFVEDVLKLGDGAVVELDKLAGDPVDVYVNDRKVAKGEVLVLNDNFCVRINEIVDLSEA